MSLAQAIPVIDPRVRHVGVSKLRQINATELKRQSEKQETLVIQVDDTPVAVIIGYEAYIDIQKMAMTAHPGTLAKAAVAK